MSDNCLQGIQFRSRTRYNRRQLVASEAAEDKQWLITVSESSRNLSKPAETEKRDIKMPLRM
ncbi:MAG: hypothetical protein NVS9B5_29100 [Terriglobales bacterium]